MTGKAKITKEDFRAVPNWEERREINAEFLDGWNKWIRRKPQRLYDVVSRDMPGKFTVSASCWREGEYTFGFTAKENGREIMSASRSFDMKEKKVHHDRFVVSEAWQGQGLAAVFLGNLMGLYKSMGIKEVSLMASMSNGAYTWARFGFTPDQEDWDRLRTRQIKDNLEELGDKVPRRTRTLVLAALRRKNPRTIWILADLTQKIDGETLGKKLLVGERWDGKLRLDDAEAMKRFWSYVDAARPRYLAAMEQRKSGKPPEGGLKQLFDSAGDRMVELEGDWDSPPPRRDDPFKPVWRR
jgi:GNAT superfamily N-acetyltransferase